MAGFKFKGLTPEQAARKLIEEGNDKVAQIARITDESVEEAIVLQRELLDKAVTPGGARRFARGQGGSAGRNDTGRMIGAISGFTTYTGKTIKGQWGWFDPTDKYWGIQDWGNGKIEAAHSLLDSFVQIAQKWESRIRREVK